MPDEPIVRRLLADYALPVAHVEARRITLAPGAPTGPHWHNGPVFGVILAGSAAFQVEDVETETLRPGDVFYEPAERRISRFDATDEGVDFLAWFPLEAGQAAALVPLDAEGPDAP
jgi:quercetin dioxygenase-like cupin family protein